MNKIVSTKNSAIFLATILIAGAIALSFPSFMTGSAQAQPYYGGEMDNDYQKSYGKDNRDKSKDSSKSVDINKINCINTNLNINGNNTGNVSIGNKGHVDTEEGYSGAYSSGGGYYDGYNNKQNKGIECIINNNNNNTNVVAGGQPPIPPIDECPEAEDIEACFEQLLGGGQFEELLDALNSSTGVTVEING